MDGFFHHISSPIRLKIDTHAWGFIYNIKQKEIMDEIAHILHTPSKNNSSQV